MKNPSVSKPPRLDIVLPCFNEEEVLPTTIASMRKLLSDLLQANLASIDSALVFVDDGSSDNSWGIIQAASDAYENVVGIRLAKNAGHQYALLAGLEYSSADMVLTIDADLQDDIQVIPDMVAKAAAGCDVVYGVRADRTTDSFFKRHTAELYYRMLSILGVDVIHNHADFRLMKKNAIDRLRLFQEKNLYLRGIVPLIGHKTDSVYYDRLERTAGDTKYPFGKMLALAVSGVTSFSAVPLRLIAALGLMVFLLSFLLMLWVVWVRFFAGTAVPGWASTLLPTFFLGGIQLLSLGVIGEYVAKIYIESKDRPRYFVETVTRDRN